MELGISAKRWQVGRSGVGFKPQYVGGSLAQMISDNKYHTLVPLYWYMSVISKCKLIQRKRGNSNVLCNTVSLPEV